MFAKSRLVGGGLAALISFAGGTAAFADQPSWTGPYIGAHIGYGELSGFDVTQSPANAATEAFVGDALLVGFVPSQFGSDADGPIAGLQVGYSYKLGGIVLGVEADFSGTVWKGSQTILTEFDFPPVIEARSSYSSDMDWLGTVRARIGFLPTPTLLAYITGGFAFGKVEQSLSVVADNDPGSNDDAFAGSDSATETGWTVGGGVEWAIVPRVSFKAEYLYFNLGDLPAFQTGPAGGGCNATNCLLNVTSGDEIEGHLGRIGVNFQLQ